jgi:hypothetical protein
MIFRVTIRTTLLKDFWLSAQSMNAGSFSVVCLKNRTLSRRSWWLAENSLIIAEKSRLLFTNSRRRCVCRMMWSLKDECFEVRLINREMFTQSKRSKLSKIEDEWRSEKKKKEQKRNDDVYSSMNQPLMNQAGSCAEHVITGQLTEPWIESLLVDLSSFTSFKKSYHFNSLL